MTVRLDRDEALLLMEAAPFSALAARADAARRARHGQRAFFTSSLNLNPTNVCENRCPLCAWWRAPDAPDAYFIDLEEAARRLEAARGRRIAEIHIVGGLDPRCDLDYFERLFALVRATLPGVFIQGPTATEIRSLAARAGLSVVSVLERLRGAGLGAIPGGGAEIFAPAVRARICGAKLTAQEWLDVHAAAHGLGIPTNATMLFGHLESNEDIVDHLDRLRALQDRTGGFRAFIPLPFHPAGTRLGLEIGPTGVEIARIAAVARLFLDNFEHIRMLVNYADRRLLGLLLNAGIDDLGGTSFDERIAKAAGAPDDQCFASADEMASFIERHDLEPCFVNSAYEPVEGGPKSTREEARCRRRPDQGHLLARARAAAGARLSFDEALALAEFAPLHELGRLADQVRRRKAPADRVTFVLDRNLSVTNICEAACLFCAFHVPVGSGDGFALTIEEVVEKGREAERAGATQILVQGGLNPALDLAFFEKLFARLKRETGLTVHSLSPTEIAFLARLTGIPVKETLRRLKDAGLDSLPGGGAEILVDAVRARVSPRKIAADEWIEVMRAAHGLGMKSTATMVYGLGESIADRITHLMRIRELQDETGGFTAFIPWSFQSARTRIARPRATGIEYLRIIALARLVLDNVDHLQAGWVTEGPDLAQIALHYGADDFGGVLMEERVLAATGLEASISPERVVHLIRRAGFQPMQRSTGYVAIR
jgi:dehypoxanthine futalosine cyclase